MKVVTLKLIVGEIERGSGHAPDPYRTVKVAYTTDGIKVFDFDHHLENGNLTKQEFAKLFKDLKGEKI